MENTMNEEVVEMTEEVAMEAAEKLTTIKPEGKWVAVGAAIGAVGIGLGVVIKKQIDKKRANADGNTQTNGKKWKDKISKLPNVFRKKDTSTDEVKPEEN